MRILRSDEKTYCQPIIENGIKKGWLGEYGRRLTDDEVESLKEDPYQIFINEKE